MHCKTTKLQDLELSEQEERRYEQLCTMASDFARNGQSAELKSMIDHGFSVDFKDAKGNSLLMLASYHNQLECAQMLLECGARVDERNDRGQTPLAGVCFKGYEQMAKLLISYGADVRANNGLGMTPWHFALMFGHFRLAKRLKSWSKIA